MISVNEYFNSTVKSLGYKTAKGNSTIGVMEDGEYEFKTSTHEIMTVIEGELAVQLPNNSDWNSFKAGQSFEVKADSSFKVKSVGQTSYLCNYQ